MFSLKKKFAPFDQEFAATLKHVLERGQKKGLGFWLPVSPVFAMHNSGWINRYTTHVAAVWGAWTGEMENEAERIAHGLRKRDVGPPSGS